MPTSRLCRDVGNGGYLKYRIRCGYVKIPESPTVQETQEFFEKDLPLEQVRGIEPPCSAWEADILPLNYTCISILPYYSIL